MKYIKFLFLKIPYFKYILKIKEIKLLLKREDFQTDNEYLKNFIPVYKNSNTNFYFFSGSAGSGKSNLIKEFSRYLNFEKKKFQITSTTGTSVVDFKDGKTIHSFSGMDLEKDKDSLQKIIETRKFKRYIKKEIKDIDVLIIDEISMLWYQQFDLLNEIFQKARKNKEYFGGLELFLFGDFLQLPPIVTSKDSLKYNLPKNYIPWVFDSSIWEKLEFIYLNLNTHYRQKDIDFIKQLDRLRLGINFDLKYINSLKNNRDNALKLRAQNKEVDEINNIALKNNINKLHSFDSYIYCKEKELYKPIIDDLYKRFEYKLSLKVGSRVIHLINEFERKLVNGSTGTVLKISESGILIDWDSGFKTNLKKYDYKVFDEYENEKLHFSQYPIKLAHSITIHKSQGMTLEHFDIDGSKIWQEGQAYVALSRGKDPKKINLNNLSSSSIKTNKKALGFYLSKRKNFIQLSKGDRYRLSESESKLLKEKYRKNHNNEKWRDITWVQENLINTKLINIYQYKYFLNQPGVYKITIINKNGRKSFYIGESMNLMQRLSYHVMNAFDEELKIKKKQNVTLKIKEAGIKNISFETLTQPNWFIGKYISKDEWNETKTSYKRNIIRKFLRYEENQEIIKLKNSISEEGIENRT